jgi:hypothetical protein
MLAAWMALERRSFSLVDPLDLIVTVKLWPVSYPETVTAMMPLTMNAISPSPRFSDSRWPPKSSEDMRDTRIMG